MNRQRTNVRARYFRCAHIQRTPAPVAEPKPTIASVVLNWAVDLWPGAALVLGGAVVIYAGLQG